MHAFLRLVAALCVVASAALAGCTAGGSDSGSSDGSSSTRPGGQVSGNVSANGTSANATVSGGYGSNSTSNGTFNGTGNATGPRSETRQGNVSGLAILTSQPSASETVSVRNGTTELTMNLTVDGDELTLHIRPPGCSEASCEQTVTTSGGSGQTVISSPEAGSWDLKLTPAPSALGPVESSYTLEIAWSP